MGTINAMNSKPVKWEIKFPADCFPLNLAAFTEQLQRSAIEGALVAADGNRTEAAKLIQVSRRQFYRLCAILGISLDKEAARIQKLKRDIERAKQEALKQAGQALPGTLAQRRGKGWVQ